MANDKLQYWINKINQQEMPIFKYSMEAIVRITGRDDSSGSDLASVILKDTNLTARILRIANSCVYNPSGTRINTITNAVLLLGFNVVREISISVAVIDSLLRGARRVHVLKLMAAAFHAAVQARAIANFAEEEQSEEVFIATLLLQLGEMAYWCVADKQGDELLERMQASTQSFEHLQKEVLGFTFKRLTERIIHDWHLGELLEEVILHKNSKSRRVKHIEHGHAIARAAVLGWKSPEAEMAIEALAKHLNITFKEATTFVHNNVETAVEVAQEFGAHSAAVYIPTFRKLSDEDIAEESVDEQHQFPKPDPMLQLTILRELSGILSKKPALNHILEMVLEGMYRGIGMDRTVLAFFNPDKTELRAKFVLGKDNQDFNRAFVFIVNKDQPSLLQQLILYKRSYWVKDMKEGEYGALIDDMLRNTLQTREFFMTPIITQDIAIGIFYADRQPSGRKLDNESFESFRHFTQEACIALKFIHS